MMLRSQALAALVVLFVTFGVVFVAAGDFGVNTDVFLPDQPTATPVPPTATPIPAPAEGNADNWIEVAPNEYQYTGDTENPASITVTTAPMADFVANSGLEVPPPDAPFPLLNMLEQLRTLIQDSLTENQLQIGPDDLAGPVIELFGDVPVATLRARVPAQTAPNGFPYPGGDLFFAWFESGEDIVRVEFNYQGAPSEEMHADLRAWLDANVPDLAGIDETEAGEAPADATPEATEAGTPQPDTSEAVTETPPAEEATPEPTEAPGTDTSAEEKTPAPETSAEEAPQDNAAEAAPAPATNAMPSGPWALAAPGLFRNSDDPSADISVGVRTLEELAAQIGFTPEEGEPVTIDSVLAFEEQLIRDEIASSEQGIEITDFVGPETLTYGDVTVSYVKFTMTADNEGTTIGRTTFLGLVPINDTTASAVRYQHNFEGEPSPALYDEFLQWMEVNATALTEMPGE